MNRTQFQRLLKSRLRFRLFLLTRLPAAWASGLQVEQCSDTACTVSVPYRWFTKNPFRSTYFASLAMAAELSTGALCMQETSAAGGGISMLVVNLEATFFRKATRRTEFTCADGTEIAAAVAQAASSGEGQTVVARSTGRDSTGNTVAEFAFTWSFRRRG